MDKPTNRTCTSRGGIAMKDRESEKDAVYYVLIIEEACLGKPEEQMYLRRIDDTYSFHLFYRDVMDVNSYQFTLAELEKISNGRLARMCLFDDLQELRLIGNIVGDYWVNPLVELEPVEKV